MCQSKYDKLLEICSYLLYESEIANTAKIYLNNRIPIDIQKKFSFGYFPQQEKLNILFSFIKKKELVDLDVLYNNNYSDNSYSLLSSPLQHHNLILPYKNVYGKTIAIVGRTILNEEERKLLDIPKYKNTAFKKSKHLFGLYEAKASILEKGYAYIVEGQFDCITAHANNITNVIALGSSNMSFDQLALLLRYTNKIKLLLDNDDAGTEGRERIIAKYGKYTNIENNYLPGGFKDLDEFLKEFPINSEKELQQSLISC